MLKTILSVIALLVCTTTFTAAASSSDFKVVINNDSNGNVDVDIEVIERPNQPVVYGRICYANNAYTGRWQWEQLIQPLPVGSQCVFSYGVAMTYGFTWGTVIP